MELEGENKEIQVRSWSVPLMNRIGAHTRVMREIALPLCSLPCEGVWGRWCRPGRRPRTSHTGSLTTDFRPPRPWEIRIQSLCPSIPSSSSLHPLSSPRSCMSHTGLELTVAIEVREVPSLLSLCTLHIPLCPVYAGLGSSPGFHTCWEWTLPTELYLQLLVEKTP